MTDFFTEMAPALTANFLIVLFICGLVRIARRGQEAQDIGFFNLLLILTPLLFLLYGLYLWEGSESISRPARWTQGQQ
jgi:hypothetical protein